MSRHTFVRTGAAWMFSRYSLGERVVPSLSAGLATVWAEPAMLTRLTDLLDAVGNPITDVTVDADGFWPERISGPDGGLDVYGPEVLWLYGGSGVPVAWVTADAYVAPAGGAAVDHAHTALDLTDATTVGRALIKAADQPAARTAIAAGTSSLALGATATTAKAGNYKPPIADLPGKSVIYAAWNATTAAWNARPSTRTDLLCFYAGGPSTAPRPTDAVPGDHVLRDSV